MEFRNTATSRAGTEDGIPMSGESDDDHNRTAKDKLTSNALRAVSFDRFDKIIIVCLVAVFAALFIWLLAFNDQPFYSYLTFLGLLTLVLVGILRAVGVVQTPIMLLGGAAGVFVGLFVLTNNYHDESEQIRVLTCSDPACNTLRSYFSFLQRKDFKSAIAILSDSWKQQQKSKLGQDYYDKFPSLFDTTVSFRDFVFLLRNDFGQVKAYAVSYDVTDDVPKNTLYETRKQVFSSLTGSYDRSELVKLIIDNLGDYYAVPADKTADIAKFINDRITIDQAIDPFFISELVIDMRRNKVADLKSNSEVHSQNLIERHFVHRVSMIQEHDVWKILNFERSFIANY
jgi:hypothetical protein